LRPSILLWAYQLIQLRAFAKTHGGRLFRNAAAVKTYRTLKASGLSERRIAAEIKVSPTTI
jgi:hypothetical protein